MLLDVSAHKKNSLLSIKYFYSSMDNIKIIMYIKYNVFLCYFVALKKWFNLRPQRLNCIKYGLFQFFLTMYYVVYFMYFYPTKSAFKKCIVMHYGINNQETS